MQKMKFARPARPCGEIVVYAASAHTAALQHIIFKPAPSAFGDKSMKVKALGLLAAAAMFVTASVANATTKDFTYSDAGVAVATGSFSYATGDAGVLGYGDLSAFSVTVAGETYDLADVATLTDYIQFAYDTAANVFDVDTNSCGFAGCGFQSSLSAINSAATYGFFFNGAPGAYEEYQTGTGGSFDTITISAAPEPSAWLLMIAGVGGVGVAFRFDRRREDVVAKAA